MTAAFSDLLVYIMMYDLWPYANVFTCLHLVFSAPHTIDKRRVSNQTRERNYPDFSHLWSKFIVAIVSQNDRAIHACDQIRDTVFKSLSRYRYRSWSRIGIGIWIQSVSDTNKPASEVSFACDLSPHLHLVNSILNFSVDPFLIANIGSVLFMKPYHLSIIAFPNTSFRAFLGGSQIGQRHSRCMRYYMKGFKNNLVLA